MGTSKRDGDVTEFEGEVGPIKGGALNVAGKARRRFLGGIGRWSAALAVFGLGPEAWMQIVSRRSIVSSAVAAGAPRDAQLHPFPSDDPFNMPLGMNAWYAPTSDPATASVTGRGGGFNINNGWSHPIYFPTTSHPLHRITNSTNRGTVESYISEEDARYWLEERLQSNTTAAGEGQSGYRDKHLHIIRGNDLVECFGWNRTSSTTAETQRLVRNRLDRFAHSAGSDPMRNRRGTRAWGGSAIAGLIRKHEVETSSPYIPHALAIGMTQNGQLGKANQGNPSSPLYPVTLMFPANEVDGFAYSDPGSVRMGMRFALDPSLATDAWINNISNVHHRAIARALRDYGCIVVDQASANVLYGEQGINGTVANNMTGWGFMAQHLRRVAGAGPVHNPAESHWQTWRSNGHGWGGGTPRVPYSPPLSGNLPPAGPEAPAAIEVTGARTFDGTG